MTKSRGIRVSRGTRSAWVAEQQGKHHCGCGCGEEVQLRSEHYPTPPRFIHGHNQTITHRKPPKERVACGCGCGALAAAGKRFVSGHNAVGRLVSDETRQKMRETKLGERNPQYGRRAHNYVGWTRHAAGYILVSVPDHPFAVNGRVMEHRLVVERYLRENRPDSPHLIKLGNRLYLRPELQVHHDDEVKDNNSLGNLVVMTVDEHSRLHQERERAKRQRPA